MSGPYPRGLLFRHRVLGRLRETDEVSRDGVEWTQVSLVPGLRMSQVRTERDRVVPAWEEERARARVRWMDERTGRDRRARDATDRPDLGQRSGERRTPIAAPAYSPAFHGEPTGRRGRARLRPLMITAAVLIIVGVCVFLGYRYLPRDGLRVDVRASGALRCPQAVPRAVADANGVRQDGPWNGLS